MRLLAALDFGLTHESVVATARALAPALGLEAHLVHVIPDPYFQGLAHRFPDLAPLLREALDRVEARVREALGATGLKARVLRGLPAFAVGGEAARAKLVVLGVAFTVTFVLTPVVRRMAERPANLGFFLRSLATTG